MAEEQTSAEELRPGQADCDTYYTCFFRSDPPEKGFKLYDDIIYKVYSGLQIESKSLPDYVKSIFGDKVGEKLNAHFFKLIAKEVAAWVLVNCRGGTLNKTLSVKGLLLLPIKEYKRSVNEEKYQPFLEIVYPPSKGTTGVDTWVEGGATYLVSSPHLRLWDEKGILRTEVDPKIYGVLDSKKAGNNFYFPSQIWKDLLTDLTKEVQKSPYILPSEKAVSLAKAVLKILQEFIPNGKVNPSNLINLISAYVESQLKGKSRGTDPCIDIATATSSAPPAKEYVGSAEVSYGKSTIFAVWPDRDQWRKAIFSADKVQERYYRPLFGHANKEESKPASLRIYSLPTAKIGEILQGNLRAPTIEEETFIDPANAAKAAFYTDFLVQSYTCNKADATQTLPTFGDTHLFFMNNPLTNISVNGIVMNTTDFPWKDRLLLYYDMLLKGSALVPQEKVAVLLLDGWAHIGFITNLQITNTAERENAADFIFNFISLLDIPSPSTTQQIVNEPEGNYELEKQELGEIPETKVYGDYAGYKKETPILRLKHKSIVDRILSAIVPGLNTRTIRKLSNAFEGIRKFGWRGAWGQAQNFSRDYKIAKNLGISMFDYDVRLPNK